MSAINRNLLVCATYAPSQIPEARPSKENVGDGSPVPKSTTFVPGHINSVNACEFAGKMRNAEPDTAGTGNPSPTVLKGECGSAPFPVRTARQIPVCRDKVLMY